MKQSVDPNIPLLFFAFAFFVVLLSLFSKYSFQSSGTKQISQLNKQIISPTVTPYKLGTTANFSRTVECNYMSATASMSAIIQNADVFARFGNNTFLVTGDCLYRWQLGQKEGSKQCGVGQYVSVGKRLLGSGLITSSSIGDTVKKMGESQALASIDFQKLLNTCKNSKEVKVEVFALPQGVLFK